MLMRTPTVTAAPLPDDFQPYKYGGKELDRENGLDLYDFAARQYDPATGRFTTVDPKAESYPHLSPYLYCAANPIRNIDPTGIYVVENLNDDMAYKMIAVFPEQRDNALEKDYNVAKRQGVPIIIAR